MLLTEFLKTSNSRVSYGNRWLVCNEDGAFTVYEHLYGQKKVTEIIHTFDEDHAVAALSEE